MGHGRRRGLAWGVVMMVGLAPAIAGAQTVPGPARDAGAGDAQAPAGARLAPLERVTTPATPAQRRASRMTTEAGRALLKGRPDEALALADSALAADPKAAWAHYDRALALAALDRIDDALLSFDRAVRFLPEADVWGRSVAVWGRATMLRDAGRCDEAKSAFNEYIAVVAATDKAAADEAYRQASACKTAAERELEAVPKPR